MKEKLRKIMMKKRNNLSKSEVLEKSNRIKKRLFEMSNFKKVHTVLFYISYDNEVYTHDMIKESLSNGKHVIVPLTDKKNRRLILSELNNWDELAPGAYNILEPKREHVHEVAVDTVDLILVPGVAFDLYGHRIGHGMGYYDILLQNSKRALHVGLAFELQMVDKIPVEEHDVAVDIIVTEERIISC